MSIFLLAFCLKADYSRIILDISWCRYILFHINRIIDFDRVAHATIAHEFSAIDAPILRLQITS